MAMKRDLVTSNDEGPSRFYLQYSFPPSSVGETGRFAGPGRREVGHGMLAERALLPVIPDEVCSRLSSCLSSCSPAATFSLELLICISQG